MCILNCYILKCYFQCYIVLSMVLFAMVKCSGIVITPGVLCDGLACKCGYDLVICECIHQVQRIVIKPKEIDLGVSNITIINCQTVQFQTGSIRNIASLRTINLYNINRLELQEKSLDWAGDNDRTSLTFGQTYIDFPKISITIKNSKIPVINRYTFNGNIQEINFESDVIGKIDQFAFTNLNENEKIHFKNTSIDSIQVQGFKKFSTNMLLFENSSVNSDLISRTFSDVTVHKIFKISDRCRFKNIKPSAFLLHQPLKVEIAESTFQTLDGEAFKVQVTGEATFRDNFFDTVNPGAFISITAKRQPKYDFIFANNTINKLYNHSLDFRTSDFNVKLYSINLNITCSCENIVNWKRLLFNANDIRAIYCVHSEKQLNRPINADDYGVKYCSTSAGKLKIVIIVLLVISVILFVAGGVFIYFRRQSIKNERKEWINNASPIVNRKYRNNSTNSSSSIKCANGKLPIIVPDGRTYRETVLVVESADLLTTEL